MKKINLLIVLITLASSLTAQNVGIGTVVPTAKLHINGTSDTTQLLIDANSVQSNTKPLIKLRNGSGLELLRVHSDDTSNLFIGRNAGRVNDAAGGGNSNSFMGSRSGYSNTTGYENTAIGRNALLSNSTGCRNTAIGTNSLFTQSFSNGGVNWRSENVAVGYNALYLNQPTSNLNGIQNTAVGSYALQVNTIGAGNTAVGYGSLTSNTSGSYNTASGNSALLYNLGSYNSATGALALYSNVGGILNTANGYNTLFSNYSGNYNTATGAESLSENTSGEYNTANGVYALRENTTGKENTAIGAQALTNNSTGSQNTAVGYNALYSQTFDNGGSNWNSGNVAVGYNALYLNQPTSSIEGINNTAVGAYAMQGNTKGPYNTALGYAALVSNTTGSDNTANGNNALFKNTSGVYNTAIGSNALANNTTGYSNTAIGYGALITNVGGGFNIAIGSGSGNVGPNLNNTVGIGNSGYLPGASNQVLIGNASTSFIGGAVGFTNQSDARIKNTIVEDVKGLDFILRLRPVTYHVSIKAITAITGNKETPDFPEKYDREKVKYTGFLAQEVEQAAKTAGYDFSGIYIPQKSTELYGLRYAEFVVPLVKAVQEQQAIIKQQENKILQQQLQYEDLLKRVESLEKKN